jgi:curli biogenesis system outer membrane secretion channel CsgG
MPMTRTPAPPLVLLVAGALALLALLALGGCSSGTVVARGGGASLEQALAEPAEGKYRIAVAPVIDKTGDKRRSIPRQLDLLNVERGALERLRPEALTSGVRDMLVTELFQSKKFIVLDRDALDQVVVEQEFQQSARVGDETRVPLGQLEGAELLVLAAITSFDAGTERKTLWIPFVFDEDDVGVLDLGYAKGQVVMDLRVVDVRTGRVVSSVAVRGQNQLVDVSVDVELHNGSFTVPLPNALRMFQNTPVEKALQEMVTAAVGHIAARARKGMAADGGADDAPTRALAPTGGAR